MSDTETAAAGHVCPHCDQVGCPRDVPLTYDAEGFRHCTSCGASSEHVQLYELGDDVCTCYDCCFRPAPQP